MTESQVKQMQEMQEEAKQEQKRLFDPRAY